MLATVVAQVARSILNRGNRATAGYDELRNSPRRAGDYFVLAFWGTFFLARWLYIVVTVEQTIRRNFVIHDSHAFNFGQVSLSNFFFFFLKKLNECVNML